ncbi:hypothetical protein BN132_418 [Cronobacter turicensis 564]|nr:hypothetical protein BN132_418 [Cronobacter turicensis 564]
MAGSTSLSGQVEMRVTTPSLTCARISHLPPQSNVLHVGTIFSAACGCTPGASALAVPAWTKSGAAASADVARRKSRRVNPPSPGPSFWVSGFILFPHQKGVFCKALRRESLMSINRKKLNDA